MENRHVFHICDAITFPVIVMWDEDDLPLMVYIKPKCPSD